MPTKDLLLESMLRECDLCIHLHGKIPPGTEGFRFTPGQRSTLELLRYVSVLGPAIVRSMLANSWDPYKALSEESKSMEFAGFPAAMERQKAALRETFAGITDGDLADREFTLPWGATRPLGQALLELPYASLVAYRMQLFLHAKAAGNGSIGTANCWGGMDAPPAG